MAARSLLLGQFSTRAVRASLCTTPSPRPNFEHRPRNCPQCRMAAFPTFISLAFNLCVRLCDRVFSVSRYSKPDVERNGRESGQVLLARFHIYENAVTGTLSHNAAICALAYGR